MTNDATSDRQGAESGSRGPIAFDASGLVPVVAQDEATGDVLLLAYMNGEALRQTLAEGILVLWSRSRGRLWRKGEQSGHSLCVSELRVNCEGNSLLARVRLEGSGACHEGYRSCYFRCLAMGADGELAAAVMEERVFDPAAVYVGLPSGPAMPPSDDFPNQRGDVEESAAVVAELERDARALYSAYERLRDEDHTPTSRTSQLLRESSHEATAWHALQRGVDELAELQGVLARTHWHRGGDDDVILEAGQVAYWAMIAAIALEYPYAAWHPHALWLASWSDTDAELPPQDEGLLFDCAGLILSAGHLCAEASVHPGRVVAADLAALRAKHPDLGATEG